MRSKWLFLVAFLLTGCGEAVWNPDLKTTDPLPAGTPFTEALQHGCPDSVQEIDSETFTISWSRARIVAVAPFFSRRETGSVTYLVRKGKLTGAANPTIGAAVGEGVGFGSGAAGPLRSSAGTLGLFPLFAVVLAWQLGRSFKEQGRHARWPLAAVAVFLLGTSFGSERSGVVAPGGIAQGSPSGELVNELNAPSRVIKLPGDYGALLAYETRESKHVIVGGTDAATTQVYLVQRGKVVAESAKTQTLAAQYYLFPFFETHEARVHAAIAWSVALGAIALFAATREKRRSGASPLAPAVQSPGA